MFTKKICVKRGDKTASIIKYKPKVQFTKTASAFSPLLPDINENLHNTHIIGKIAIFHL